jgi:hypothetical protein
MFAARALISRAMEIDPLSSINQSLVGLNLMVEGRFVEALAPYRLAFELDKIPPAYFTVATAPTRAGKKAEADDLLATLVRMMGAAPVGRFGAFTRHALRGERAEALEAVTPGLESFAGHVSYVAWHMGAGYALIGESDNAFVWMRRAKGLGFVNHPFLMSDPLLEPLRGDVRFPAFADEMRRAWEEFEV